MNSDERSEELPRYYGKYRGTVVLNVDPEFRGRIVAMVPDVLGMIPSSWALPCLPVAGLQMGVHAVPVIGAGVWIEFEQGDPDYPIWSGCFPGSAADVPAAAQLVPPGVPAITMQTPAQSSLTISDMPHTPTTGGIMLRSGASMIVVNASGIYITNGAATMTMIGPTIDFNVGALTVLK